MRRCVLFTVAVAILYCPFSVFAEGSYDQCSATVLEATNLIEEGRLEEAEQILKNAEFTCPESGEIYSNLGVIAMTNNDLKEASALFDKAFFHTDLEDANLFLLYYNAALCAYKLADYDKARAYFEKCIELEPAFGYAHYNVALVYWESGDPSRTYQSLEEAARIFRRENNLALYGQTKALINRVIVEDAPLFQDRKEELLESASRLYKEGAVDDAIELMEKVVKIDAGYAEAHYRLGVMYISQQRYSDAIPLMEMTIKLEPSHIKAYINLASLRGKQGDYAKALQVLDKAKKLEPKNPKIYYNIGLVYKSNYDYAQAKTYLEKAFDLAHKQGDTQFAARVSKALSTLYEDRRR